MYACRQQAEGDAGQAVGKMCRLGTGQTKMKDTHFRLTCCGMLCTCIWISSLDGPLCGRVCGSCTNIKANRKNTNIAAYFWAPKHKCVTNQAELSPAKMSWACSINSNGGSDRLLRLLRRLLLIFFWIYSEKKTVHQVKIILKSVTSFYLISGVFDLNQRLNELFIISFIHFFETRPPECCSASFDSPVARLILKSQQHVASNDMTNVDSASFTFRLPVCGYKCMCKWECVWLWLCVVCVLQCKQCFLFGE